MAPAQRQLPREPDVEAGAPGLRVDVAVLGAVLRQFRVATGLSQERLGFKADLHRNYVSDVERGLRNPTFLVLEIWLAALGVSWARFGEALDHAGVHHTAAGDKPRR